MRIALKVDVDTYRGTIEGVPRLLALFERYGVKATFLFSMGPDHTGRALRRIFRRGFLAKVRRTSVTNHYGLKTLMYGVLLPGPDIGRKAGHIMRDARAAGHEVGIHCYDHVKWQDFVANMDADWTANEMRRAEKAFSEIQGVPAATIGAAGWQINKHVLALEEAMGFRYASDTRGQAPFLPQMDDATSACVQLPTTLPTLDELIGSNGITEDNVDSAVFEASRRRLLHGHVYTLHAELEGMKLLHVMQRLLQKWADVGNEMSSLMSLYESLDPGQLPRKLVEWGEVDGRSGMLAVEGGAVA
jgi:peptidoglycan/xylan/chitin deacetylase (PgdA/CDA1 family)